GSPVTNSASLTVNSNPIIASGPNNLTNCPGTTASFVVNATGTSLVYQWYHGTTPLPGQTGSTLMLGSVSATDAGTNCVVVSGLCGSPVTNSASLTVNSGPVIASGPNNLTNCPGTSASFVVNATGTGLTYQWYHGTSPLPGQTGSTLLLGSVSATDIGIYSVVVSGLCGSPVTNGASLAVNSGPVIASGPNNLTNCAGTSASFL